MADQTITPQSTTTSVDQHDPSLKPEWVEDIAKKVEDTAQEDVASDSADSNKTATPDNPNPASRKYTYLDYTTEYSYIPGPVTYDSYDGEINNYVVPPNHGLTKPFLMKLRGTLRMQGCILDDDWRSISITSIVFAQSFFGTNRPFLRVELADRSRIYALVDNLEKLRVHVKTHWENLIKEVEKGDERLKKTASKDTLITATCHVTKDDPDENKRRIHKLLYEALAQAIWTHVNPQESKAFMVKREGL